LFSYQYYQKIKFSEVNDAIAVYKGAKFMKCPALMKVSAAFTKSKLNPDIVWDAFVMAEDLQNSSLENACIEVINKFNRIF
jgi:hypothetical protein